MTRDEVIAMAKEATQDHEVRWSESDAQTVAFFLRLAALVAARERERCEKAVENSSSCFTSDQAYIKKLAVAAIRALNTEGEGLDVATAQKGGE